MTRTDEAARVRRLVSIVVLAGCATAMEPPSSAARQLNFGGEPLVGTKSVQLR